MSSITITLVLTSTGQSETIPIDSSTTTLSDLMEWTKAIFGIDGNSSASSSSLQFSKDGIYFDQNQQGTQTLQQLGIVNDDFLAVQPQSPPQQQQQHRPTVTSTTTRTNNNVPVGGGGGFGLDFSSLLASAPVTTSTTANTMTTAVGPTAVVPPVYYDGMNLDEAIHSNPHPISFVTILFTKEHLLKELNYHNPKLAYKMMNVKPNIQRGAEIWREEMVKGGIQSAMKATEQYHMDHTMEQRLKTNPNDMDAIEFFQKKESQKLIYQQYNEMMNEYPESFGKILMLYIHVKINGHPIEAFCDSGAQATIMSLKLAQECQIDHLIDTRFAGTAVGVGTGVILGRIHLVQIQINDTYYFPCSITVMDNPKPTSSSLESGSSKLSGKEMPFLFGLDMMKRHLCQIDLQKGVLRFCVGTHSTATAATTTTTTTNNNQIEEVQQLPNENGTMTTNNNNNNNNNNHFQYMETPFLHEKDLTEDKGGTQGFDPTKANDDLEMED